MHTHSVQSAQNGAVDVEEDGSEQTVQCDEIAWRDMYAHDLEREQIVIWLYLSKYLRYSDGIGVSERERGEMPRGVRVVRAKMAAKATQNNEHMHGAIGLLR